MNKRYHTVRGFASVVAPRVKQISMQLVFEQFCDWVPTYETDILRQGTCLVCLVFKASLLIIRIIGSYIFLRLSRGNILLLQLRNHLFVLDVLSQLRCHSSYNDFYYY